MSKKRKVFKTVKAMTVAAMLVAMSVIVGIFCKNFLNFGGGVFRITFENLPIILSGILYGPVAAGLVGVCADLVSYLLSNQIYPPNLVVTLGAAMVGVVSGVVSKYIVKKRGVANIIYSGAAAHIVGSMIIKTIGLYSYFGALVFLRIPLYIVIASVEILILCLLLRRDSFAKVVDYR